MNIPKIIPKIISFKGYFRRALDDDLTKATKEQVVQPQPTQDTFIKSVIPEEDKKGGILKGQKKESL